MQVSAAEERRAAGRWAAGRAELAFNNRQAEPFPLASLIMRGEAPFLLGVRSTHQWRPSSNPPPNWAEAIGSARSPSLSS